MKADYINDRTWRCPGCGAETRQPRAVTGYAHDCPKRGKDGRKIKRDYVLVADRRGALL